jgi:beta-N-acetylhexosaminidase
MIFYRFLFIITSLSVTSITGLAQPKPTKIKPDFLTNYNQKWVDSLFQSLTLDQKIGQLLMPRGNYSGKPHDIEKLISWVQDYKIGGIVFFATNPTRQAALTNQLQAISKTPLFIGQDLEWGLNMRLDSTDRFPYAMALGAIKNSSFLIYNMGKEIGSQCRRMGIHINYAPVVDVNINPANPVINFRSYGGDKTKVASIANDIMSGMQQASILCTAKHFPGHGDTNVDSHHDLPLINHDRKRLYEIELHPFKTLINNGLSGIMTAHLNIPSLEPKANLASTFSKSIITDLLQVELEFDGLVFTDAMEMEGAIKNFPKGEAFVQALLAGNDIIETFMDVPTAVAEIKKAINTGRISRQLIDAKVRKILKAKSWVGLDKYKPIVMNNLVQDLNTINGDILNYKLAKESITAVKNEKNLLPIRSLDKTFAVISLEGNKDNAFVTMVNNYVHADIYYIPKAATADQVDSVILATKIYDMVILGIQFADIRPSKKYGLTPENTMHIRKLISIPNAIIALMASPFVMQNIPEFANCHSLVLGYQLTPYTESAIAQAIFGAESISGTLPMTINDYFIIGNSINCQSLNRITYGPSEIVGIDRQVMQRTIDSIANGGINAKAFPGCVVQFSKDGHVFTQKSYGFLTYTAINNSEQSDLAKIDDAMDNFDLTVNSTATSNTQSSIGKVHIHDSYDLASITKIAASTLAIMQLVSEGKLDINKTLGDYVPAARNTNKANLKLKDMLTHRSGLKAWIPFWRDAIDTVATLNKAISKEFIPLDSIIKIGHKPSWFCRIFGKKTKTIFDLVTTAKAHPTLFQKSLKSTTIVWKVNTFSNKKSLEYPIEINDHLYAHKDVFTHIKKAILYSSLSDTSAHKYVYSDLHFYFYPEIVKSITEMTFTEYLSNTYQKLGAHSLTFLPNSNKKHIAPTELDSLFRGGLIHGRVHDEGAAMMGGISGHAGLFGNANDLHTIMYMYLRKGKYGDESYIKSDVMDQFTAYQFESEKNRRGLGFDKKDFDKSVNNGPSLASNESFGHSGFTGTFTWVDPQSQLVYVFLSNRVFPTRNNSLINSMKIRQSIGDAVIKSLGSYIEK